jgi:cell division protein FtsW
MLFAVGLVFSNMAASPDMVRTGDSMVASVAKHAVAAAIGLAALFALSGARVQRIRAFAWPLLIACFIALLLVWVPYIGHKANGSYRWIGFGSLRVQPSEFAKLAMILYLAAVVCDRDYPIRDWWQGLFPPVAVISVVSITIEREPDLGTAIVVFMTSMSILYVAGARAKHLAWVFGVAIVLAAIVTALAPHRQERFVAWIAPEAHARTSGYQILQSLIAVSEAGLPGRGFGNGEGRHYIPASGTDYIMATVAEETGLLGVALVTFGLAFLVWQGYRGARRTADPFWSLVSAGVGSMLMWQAVLNLAVVTNSVPSTGVPMPLISAGGSSLMVCLASLGILCRPSADAAGRGAGA